MSAELEFSPAMVFTMAVAFVGISFFMGMLVHSALIYEDKVNLKRDSKRAWILSMAAGAGITGCLFMDITMFYTKSPIPLINYIEYDVLIFTCSNDDNYLILQMD